jgi:hypothetical protein
MNKIDGQINEPISCEARAVHDVLHVKLLPQKYKPVPPIIGRKFAH